MLFPLAGGSRPGAMWAAGESAAVLPPTPQDPMTVDLHIK